MISRLLPSWTGWHILPWSHVFSFSCLGTCIYFVTLIHRLNIGEFVNILSIIVNMHCKKKVGGSTITLRKIAADIHIDKSVWFWFLNLTSPSSFAPPYDYHSLPPPPPPSNTLLICNKNIIIVKLDYLALFVVGEKFRWFYENIEEEKTQYSCYEVCELIERWVFCCAFFVD